MTTKQFWTSLTAGVLISLAIVAAVATLTISHLPVPAPPTPIPAPNPQPVPPARGVPAVAIAQQKAKLKLSDGRTATFRFAISGRTLLCTAAVGLDQVVSYDLVPTGDPLPPDPTPTPAPPAPNPPVPSPQPPAPAPGPAASNLRVLFLYDPLTLNEMPAERQAILVSPELRSYLDKHCPLESGCTSGVCPLAAAATTPSYRFVPNRLDVSRLTPIWQQTFRAAAGRPVPWMIAVNETGQTVIDQSWPASVDETLKLLKKVGGE